MFGKVLYVGVRIIPITIEEVQVYTYRVEFVPPTSRITDVVTTPALLVVLGGGYLLRSISVLNIVDVLVLFVRLLTASNIVSAVMVVAIDACNHRIDSIRWALRQH